MWAFTILTYTRTRRVRTPTHTDNRIKKMTYTDVGFHFLLTYTRTLEKMNTRPSVEKKELGLI